MDELTRRLRERLKAERHQRGLSLETLAAASGVSRSMISNIERGTKAPTVLVLSRLATALGVTVSRLLGEDQAQRVIKRPVSDQPCIIDAEGWQRRILSPALPGVEFEFIRTTIPPRVTLGSFAGHAAGSREYVAVETGELSVTVDGTEYWLGPGDALYYAGDATHAFSNPGDAVCVYYTAMHVATAHTTTQESP